MAGRHTEARPEIGLTTVVQRAVDDHLDGPAHEIGRRPAEGMFSAVRPAPVAGPEPGGFGGGRRLEPPDVARVGATTAARNAVDAGGDDGGEPVHSTGIPARPSV